MSFNFKKSLYICVSALMILAIMAPTVSVNGHSIDNVRSHRIVHHINVHKDNELRINYLKRRHTRNLRRFNRIKHYTNNHQKDLRKLNLYLRHVQKHSHRHGSKYIIIVRRLNNDKTHLVNLIRTNQLGMVRLTKLVNSEQHIIDMMRHSNAAQHISLLSRNYGLNDNLGNSYGEFNGIFYVNNNGHVSHYSSHVTDLNGRLNGGINLNGKDYPLNSSAIRQISRNFSGTEDQISNLNQQFSRFNNQLNDEVQSDVNFDFDGFLN